MCFISQGMTPLMYAAQYNEIESAKLLIQYGANPNATTTMPNGRCYYTLTTTNMTPLHYAARYSSEEMIDLLLDNGAVTFIKTKTSGYKQKDEYPIDWFKRYSSPVYPVLQDFVLLIYQLIFLPVWV